MRQKALLGVIILLVGILGLSIGYWWIPREPLYEEVEVVKYVEVAASPSNILRNFETLEELKFWLSRDKTNELPGYEQKWCIERAEMLIKMGETSGYRLHLEILTKAEYDSFEVYKQAVKIPQVPYLGTWPSLEEDMAHAICSALIGDYLYYIEPLTDDVWYFGYLVR